MRGSIATNPAAAQAIQLEVDSTARESAPLSSQSIALNPVAVPTVGSGVGARVGSVVGPKEGAGVARAEKQTSQSAKSLLQVAWRVGIATLRGVKACRRPSGTTQGRPGQRKEHSESWGEFN